MHEIIHVVDPESLAGTRQRGLEIEVVNGQALGPGYYFVLWPTRLSEHEGKRYFGPFPTLVQARLLQRSALALGLVPDGRVIRPITECRSIARPSVTPGASWFPLQSIGIVSATAARAA